VKYPLYIITGTPGSGKSTTLSAFFALQTEYLVFDIDWLAEAGSQLAAREIFSDPSTWKPYGLLWFEILHSIYKNGHTPLFFTPNDPHDTERFGRPTWCSQIHWLLLDCDDLTRRRCLAGRPDWNESRIAEAIADANELRQAILVQLDTKLLPPNEVAAEILSWLA
jgi:hypothetical protein